MSGLYYRPSTSELNSEVMNQEGEDDESPLNSLLNDVPNYMQPDPIKSKLNSAVKSDKKNIKDDSVNIKKFLLVLVINIVIIKKIIRIM
ncbi:unnamed protein product [Schistosoma intercalatum]|nr:unnamed protein product [Schistosoma intercalatum]